MTNPFDRDVAGPPDFVDPADLPASTRREQVEDVDPFDPGPVPSSPRRPSKRRSRRSADGDAPPRSRRQPPAPEQDPEANPYDVAKAIVLRQLTMAPRSRKQLSDKLAQRGCDPEVADAVLDRMTEVGLIDDEAYAAMLVRSQQAGRGLAKRALAQELRKKGIDDEITRATLDEVDPEAEKERARALVAKKMRSMHGLDAAVQTRRLAGMLARKGYSSSVSWSVIREAIAQADEHQRD
ncbi:regulatory protein RecX [Yimella sp. cx-51]|uniref:regulatory protein RecX n=1 Tax=Yimella sp. cx-51 TaxID=2770551 RepID=UPI001FCB2A18|nr:regulatory protein RecX [Yimella sp. cx-51]